MHSRTLLMSFLLLSTLTQVCCQNPSAQSSRPGAAAGQRTVIMFTSWHDPSEGAFSLNVPEGWQVSGGTTRDSEIDPHHVLRTVSPDGGIRIFMGDSGVIPRLEPNPILEYGGVHEGQTLPADSGGQLLVARYQTGEQFAQSYILGTLCPQAQITSSGVLTDATNLLNQQALEYGRATGAAAEAWVGEANFRCGTQSGHVRASTVIGRSPNGAGVWAVLELSGFMVADPAQSAMASYILNNIEQHRFQPADESGMGGATGAEDERRYRGGHSRPTANGSQHSRTRPPGSTQQSD
jgi:hypothetical protein